MAEKKEREVILVKLHRNPQYMVQTCRLLNREWPRSEAARLHSLEQSNDTLPLHMVLVDVPQDQVIGHIRIKGEPCQRISSAFIESLVVEPRLRGRGLGKLIMSEAEQVIKAMGYRRVVLTTMEKTGFYRSIGYTIVNQTMSQSFPPSFVPTGKGTLSPAPPSPPPLLPPSTTNNKAKTLMEKMIY